MQTVTARLLTGKLQAVQSTNTTRHAAAAADASTYPPPQKLPTDEANTPMCTHTLPQIHISTHTASAHKLLCPALTVLQTHSEWPAAASAVSQHEAWPWPLNQPSCHHQHHSRHSSRRHCREHVTSTTATAAAAAAAGPCAPAVHAGSLRGGLCLFARCAIWPQRLPPARWRTCTHTAAARGKKWTSCSGPLLASVASAWQAGASLEAKGVLLAVMLHCQLPFADTPHSSKQPPPCPPSPPKHTCSLSHSALICSLSSAPSPPPHICNPSTHLPHAPKTRAVV